ncbi:MULTISPECIES: hypothetical protein [unclassified Streptomyces]|uniref:hypothetical protein n=1 Tax=unclassified Streptomyces TaxID=2593676 RepID=UPI002E0D1BE2|nr:hypothetical protein OG299_22115 [Streptomyces sp. NBC_01296]WSW60374.1 hypothetical protein OG513_18310 [Streptomyces sp. NBC_00998]
MLLGPAAQGQVKVEYLLASFPDRGGAGGLVRAVNALRASAEAGRFTDGHLPAMAAQVPGLRGEAFDRAVAEQTYKGWVGGTA